MGTDQSGAVKTAGERLEAIKRWARRTFVAAVVGASFLGVMATVSAYFAFDYVRLKIAAGRAIESFNEEMKEKFPRAAAGPPRKGRIPF